MAAAAIDLDIFVVDAGAHTVRAGRAEDFPDDAKSPHVVLPSVVRPAGADDADSAQPATTKIFDAHGRIAHWDGYQGMLEYILYKQLGWPAGDEGYLLLTKNGPVATRADRERATQLAFEAFNVKGLYLLDAGVAAVYASGTSSGVAVDIGHSGTTVTQVVEGLATPSAQQRLPLGGALLDTVLQQRLQAKGVQAKAANAQWLKEKCMAVAESADAFDDMTHGENRMEATSEFELPDGTKVQVGTEGPPMLDQAEHQYLELCRHELGEVLFTPALAGNALPQASRDTCLGIAEAAFASASMSAEPSVRDELLNATLLCGGSAAAAQLHDRFMAEMRARVPVQTTVKAHKVPDYMPKRSAQYASYIGGALVAKGLHAKHIFSKEDYDEKGPTHIHRVC